MKAKKITIAISAIAIIAGLSTAAYADDKWTGEVGSNWQEHVQSTKTRAQVIAELEEARAQGAVIGGEEPFYPSHTASTASRSRDEVRREAAKAAKIHDHGADNMYLGG